MDWAELRSFLGHFSKYMRILARSLPWLWRAAPWEMSFLLVALLLQGGIPAVSVALSRAVVDRVMLVLGQGEGLDQWGFLVVGWAAALVLQGMLGPLSQMNWGNLSERLRAYFRLQLMDKAHHLPDIQAFEQAEFYDELQLIQKEIDEQSSSLASFLVQVGQHLFTILTLFALLIPLGWWIPVLLLVTTLPQTIVGFRMAKEVWEQASKTSPQIRRMEYFSSIILTDTYAKEVRLFNLGGFLLGRYWSAFQDLHQTMRKLRLRQALWTTSLSILGALGNAGAFFWVVQEAFQGRLNPGDVLLFVQSLAYIQESLTITVVELVYLYDALLFMERFFRFLERPSMFLLPASGQPVSVPLRQGIRFESVDFEYPDGRAALQGISFQIRPGETVALVGENGAGKTTIIKLLSRLYDPSSGRILVDGTDLRQLDLAAWRQQIAVVFQDFGRYALKVNENMALAELGAAEDPGRLLRAATRSGFAAVLQRLPESYQTLLGKQFDGTELSGGEWQKLALARAFFRQDQAQILILDEPTAALDPRSEYEVYKSFAELAHGKTTLLVTHRLASTRMADRVLVLKAGHLIESGSHAELLAEAGEYAALWRMQADQYSER